MRLGLTGYQWIVLLSAWLGWGFDAFDALLFNYVAPDCIPQLLGQQAGSEQARQSAAYWTGMLSSLLLLGWGVGGILFGRLADRLGRSRTLVLTMLLYSGGTACCAAVHSLWGLAFFRFVSSLGIGGEWAAGAAMVAEVVPENRRVEAGALLYTAAPVGVFGAGFVAHALSAYFPAETAWRWVFLCGLIPAAVALMVRFLIREPEGWHEPQESPPLSELFGARWGKSTRSGLVLAVTALLIWWSCNAFLPLVVAGLAAQAGAAAGLSGPELASTVNQYKTSTITLFNLGGIVGTLLAIPLSIFWGRRATFGCYFTISAAAVACAFGPWPIDLEVRRWLFFAVGMSGYGALAAFTYYLPELFPTALRATGSGFCYNIGRFITCFGPLWVGHVASQAGGFQSTQKAMLGVALIPVLGLAFLPWMVETRGRALAELDQPPSI